MQRTRVAPKSYEGGSRVTHHASRTTLLALLAFLTLPALAQRPLGTDVSGYQPSINWSSVKSAGVSFAWSKATEGTGYISPYFAGQESGAQSVGVLIGAYHYARYDLNTGLGGADAEAAYFWSTANPYIKSGGAYLMPMLDVEQAPSSGETQSTVSAWVNEWCQHLVNIAGSNGVVVRPVVYTYISFASSWLNSTVTQWPLWMANYNGQNAQTGAPSGLSPWSSWNFWQYADTNWSGGDSDVFNGSMSSLAQNFVIGGTNYPSITSQPANVTVAMGSNANFSVRASGASPLAYQWQFAQANIAGAASSNYTLANVQLTNAGGYAVKVTNSYGSTLSSTAFLSVLSQLTNATGCILAPSNMVDWWPAEGNADDIFGPYNGTPQNGFSYVTGEQGLAFHFDGSTAYLLTGAPSISPPWTACFWVNRQNAPATAAALCGDGTNELKLEQYNGTRKVGFTILSSNDWTFNYTTPVGVWTHLAFVGTASGTTLYANGIFQGTTNISLPLPRAYIGAGYEPMPSHVIDYMLGGMDETMFFNRALSAGEINALYSAGSAGLYRMPIFTSIISSNGQPTLSLKGQTGKTFTIYTSTNLSTWTRLTTLANPTGALQFTDSVPPGTQKFYRAWQP